MKEICTSTTTSASAERVESTDDIFHDAREDPHSGSSSSNTSPGIHDQPNSVMKGIGAGGMDTSLEATPRQPRECNLLTGSYFVKHG